jgi:hypothetical protein
MSLQSVLDVVRERGLKIILDEKGSPRLTGGTKKDYTPALMDALKLYRSEIITRWKQNADCKKAIELAKRMPVLPHVQMEASAGDERVVVLADDRDSQVEGVLSTHRKGEHSWALHVIRMQAQHHKGQILAIEMWEVNHETGRAEFRRFFWRSENAGSGAAQETGEECPHEP